MRPPIKTVSEPIRMTSGGPTQVSMSVTRAWGISPVITSGEIGETWAYCYPDDRVLSGE